MKNKSATYALTLLLSLGFVGNSQAVSLYDAALNTLPNSQGWSYLTNPLFGVNATKSFSGGEAILNTLAVTSESAGYFSRAGFNPAMPSLDRSAGFNLGFSLQVQSESHAVANRAGFSVLVVAQDLGALELAFWENEVWAYADGSTGGLFAHGEGVAFDTKAGLVDYNLLVQGSQYSLLANGSEILSGPMRDYTAFVSPFPLNPYQTANLIFIGDDTSSAASLSALTKVDVSPVPLPSAWLLFGSALWGFWRFIRRPLAS